MIASSIKNKPLINGMVWIALIFYASGFVWLAVRHILYPGFMLPIEGDILQHIERVSKGLHPYPFPGAEFIALPYMPLYYYLSAPFYLMFGDSFSGPRLVSTLCALGSSILVILIAHRESNSSRIGCIAGILFLSGYRIMDSCLTSATSDSLMVWLLLIGFWFWAYGASKFADLAWLLFFALAFWTRQHGSFFFTSAVLYALLYRKNSLPRWSLVFALLLCGPVAYVLLGRFLGDGFFLHTFSVPGNWDRSIWFSVRRMTFVVGCYVPLMGVSTYLFVRQELSVKRKKVSQILWFLGTGIVSTLITMMVAGASNNHYIPLIATLCITAALGIHVLLQQDKFKELCATLFFITLLSTVVTIISIEKYGLNHQIPRTAPFVVAVIFVVCLIPSSVVVKRNVLALAMVVGQLLISSYYPRNSMPVTGYEEGIAKFQKEIARLDGRLIWADFGNVPSTMTGIKILRSPSWVAIEDIERQKGMVNESNRELASFRNMILSERELYIISNGKLEHMPGWGIASGRLNLIRDFDHEFSSVRQISYPWYGGGEYPRYLYRLTGSK